MTWLVQYAGVAPDNGDEVMKVLALKGIPYRAVGLRPFDSEIMGLEGLDLNQNLMCYGSVKLVRLALELGLRPGVFFDYSTFNALAWKTFIGFEMANYFSFHSVETLCSLAPELGKKNPHFIRPVMDLKLFSGAVKPEDQTFEEFFAEKFSGDHLTRYKNTLVGVAKPQHIEGEWRCFVVNKKFVTGSQYRINGQLKPDPALPDGLEAYVAKICDKWLPHDNCVVDVAMIDGEFRIMEFNCINASGMYKADVEKFVDAMQTLMV